MRLLIPYNDFSSSLSFKKKKKKNRFSVYRKPPGEFRLSNHESEANVLCHHEILTEAEPDFASRLDAGNSQPLWSQAAAPQPRLNEFLNFVNMVVYLE